MPVAFVNSGIATTGAATAATLTITYSPVAGNKVVLGIAFGGAVSAVSCADNNSNALTSNTNQNNTYQFYGTAVTGATSYKVSWTTSRHASIALAEYSGVAGVGTTGSVNNGVSNTQTISVITTKTNSFIVASIGVNGNITFTSSVGNLRNQQAGGAGNANSVEILDNTAVASGTSVTNTTTSSSITWGAVAVELFPSQGSDQLMMMGAGT
jgi:hypothetical protein